MTDALFETSGGHTPDGRLLVDGRTPCGHVAAFGPRCVTPTAAGVCGHGDVLHDLAKDKRTRTACTVHTGRKATPCGCRRFTPEEVAA